MRMTFLLFFLILVNSFKKTLKFFKSNSFIKDDFFQIFARVIIQVHIVVYLTFYK